MDLFPRSREFEAVCGESLFSQDFERSILLLSQLLAGLCCGDVGSLQPNFVSLFVIASIRSLFVVECLHCLGCLGHCSLCFGSGFREVVNKALCHLAFDFMMGFESLIWVSSVIEEEW